MLVFGLLMVLAPAGAGALLAWQNRDVVVRLRIGELVWTGHLYAVLVVGALLACWTLLGASFIRCRIDELRGRRAQARARAAEAGVRADSGHPAATAAAHGRRHHTPVRV